MDGPSTAKRKGRSLGTGARCSKRPSQIAPVNPAWYTISPTVPSAPIIAAGGFEVSPGVDVGKVGSVRQAISGASVVGDAAKALAEIVASAEPMHPEAMMTGASQVATALGMASVLLENSAGVGTARSKGMVGIGGAHSHRRAIEAESAHRRWKERIADPYGGSLANAKRRPMEDMTAVVSNPSVIGLQLVNPKTQRSHGAKVRALPCPAPARRMLGLAPRSRRRLALPRAAAAAAAALRPRRTPHPWPTGETGRISIRTKVQTPCSLSLFVVVVPQSKVAMATRDHKGVPKYPRPTHITGGKRLCHTNAEIGDILRPLKSERGAMARVHEDWEKRGFAVPP